MPKSQRTVIDVIASFLKRKHILPSDNSLLIVGADTEDVEIAKQLGFTDVTTSNLEGCGGRLALDAESMNLWDDTFDIVFTHAVLHHCQSPHKAVLECLRVAKKAFLFLEGNDSLLMKLAVKARLHDPYEFPAVVGNNYKCGGIRNSAVPNHIYRWTKHDLEKTVRTGFPEREIEVEAVQFFDFAVNELDLDLRNSTHIGKVTSLIGTGNFIRILHAGQKVANSLPGIKQQGNHFFAGILKHGYKRWIDVSSGTPRLSRSY